MYYIHTLTLKVQFVQMIYHTFCKQLYKSSRMIFISDKKTLHLNVLEHSRCSACCIFP